MHGGVWVGWVGGSGSVGGIRVFGRWVRLVWW